MINFNDRTITLGGKTTSIKQFEVWFRTPVGLAAEFNEAVEICKRLDMDPQYTMVPVCVALDDTGRYEEIPTR